MLVNKKNLFATIDKFSNYRILVIGDIILDEYIRGKATRLSPEAPVPVLEVDKYSYVPGGAANVANNIVSLGGNAVLAGVLGNDYQADILIDLLKKSGINTDAIIKDTTRPTTLKTRLIAHNYQQLARADRETKLPISDSAKQNLMEMILPIMKSIDLIVLSDYAKGVLSDGFIQDIIKIAGTEGKLVLVDPKGLDYSKYVGADLITPNRLEAESATKSPAGTSPEILAHLIKDITQVEHVLITLGEHGLLLFSDTKINTIPAVTSEVYDVTGAGDSLISALALGIPATDKNFKASVLLGNYAAGVAVRKIGTTVVSPDELKDIIELDLMKHHHVKGHEKGSLKGSCSGTSN